METADIKSPSHIHAKPGKTHSPLDTVGQPDTGLQIDPDIERRVVRKTDLRLVPLVTALCVYPHDELGLLISSTYN